MQPWKKIVAVGQRTDGGAWRVTDGGNLAPRPRIAMPGCIARGHATFHPSSGRIGIGEGGTGEGET